MDVSKALVALDISENLDSAIDECFGKLKSADLEKIGNNFIRLILRKLAQQSRISEDDENCVSSVGQPGECGVSNNADSNKRSRIPLFDVPERRKLSKLKTNIEKLQVIRDIHHTCEQSGRAVNQYCSALKKFKYSVISPIMACFQIISIVMSRILSRNGVKQCIILIGRNTIALAQICKMDVAGAHRQYNRSLN